MQYDYISFLGGFQVRNVPKPIVARLALSEGSLGLRSYKYNDESLIPVADNHNCTDVVTATLYQFPDRELYLIEYSDG